MSLIDINQAEGSKTIIQCMTKMENTKDLNLNTTLQ